MDTAQDELLAEVERVTTLSERLAAEIRRLIAGIRSDLTVCLAHAEEIADKSRRCARLHDDDDEGSD